MKSLNERVIDGTKFIVPSVLSSTIIGLALIENIEYLQDKPNTVYLVAMGVYAAINYALIIIPKLFNK